MDIEQFDMERYQSVHENTVRYNISESGVRPLRVSDLIDSPAERKRLLDASLGYPWGNGSPKLRAAIAKWYPDATVDNVTVMNGSSEVNFTAFWALMESGDRAAVMLPNYMQTWGLGRHFGKASDAFWLRHDRESGWYLDIESLERAVTAKTRIIVITNPNNPTGHVLTEAEMRAVVRVARRSKAWLLVDEVYRGAELRGKTSPTFWGRYPRTIITGGLSKAFGLAGARIGWAVAPPKVAERLWSYRDYTTLTPSAMGEFFGAIAMQPRRREQILRRTKDIMRSQWPVAEEWLQVNEDIVFASPPHAGAIVFIGYRPNIAPLRLSERLRTEHSVLLNHAAHYGMGPKDKWFRIGFGYGVEPLRAGLARVERLLRSV